MSEGSAMAAMLAGVGLPSALAPSAGLSLPMMLGHLVFHPVPLDPEAMAWTVLLRGLQAGLEATPYWLVGVLVAGVMVGGLGRSGTRALFGQASFAEDGLAEDGLHQAPPRQAASPPLALAIWTGPLRAWALAMILPVCSLGALPVAVAMLRAGVAQGTVLTFVLTAPLWNPVTLAYGLSTKQGWYVPLLIAMTSAVSVGAGVWWLWRVDRRRRRDFRPPPDATAHDATARDAFSRLGASLTASADAAVGPSLVYVVLGLVGAGLTAAPLQYGFLEFTMQQANPFAPMTMMLVAPTSYVTPEKVMMQATTMLDTGCSMAAAFVLLALGAGLNLGTLTWLAGHLDSSESREMAGEVVEPDNRAAVVQSLVGGALVVLGLLQGASLMAIGPFVSAIVVCAYKPTADALRHLRRGHFSFEILHVLAALSACAIGAWGEGAVLLFLMGLSESVQSYVSGRTRRAIAALMTLRPDMAALIPPDGGETLVPIEALAVGDTVRVRPGERFPVDGVITEGQTWADESTLTGESRPVPKAVDSPVMAGTTNGAGSVRVTMTVPTADTALERIITLVRTALDQKTSAQRLIERWHGPYAVSVVTAAVVAFLVYWLVLGKAVGAAAYQAAVMLVVASPCAAVLASPAVMLAAISRAARLGVLIKGAAHLERLGRVEVFAFDKTGTLTTGRPEVVGVVCASGQPDSADQLLALAATLEYHSEHPLGRAVVAHARRRGWVPPADSAGDVANFRAVMGRGVVGTIQGRRVVVGREDLIADEGLPLPADLVEPCRAARAAGHTALLVVAAASPPSTDLLAGVISLADQPRPEASATLATLRDLGARRTVMLTGDHVAVAAAVAAAVGVDEFSAALLPQDKVQRLAELRGLPPTAGFPAPDPNRTATPTGPVVAMVGDGINDAPALAAADLGIAMGKAGSDVALEAADVVLMADDLAALPRAVALSRLATARASWNLQFALASIAVLMVATFAGLPLWVAVIGHEGSTVLVALNGLRLLWQTLPQPVAPAS